MPEPHDLYPTLWTADDLARIFKVHKNTVYAWVTRREIPFVKLPGNTTRFPRKKVESWLQKRLASGKPLEKGIYF